jgi:shikimate kinase
MGCGKSTLGPLLAAELSCPFFDLDGEIARVHGPIPALFASRGESGFRAIEHLQLETLLSTLPRPAVLALGGGAFIQPGNRELLARYRATAIYLDAPFEVLHRRILASAAERPLAADPEQLRRLYELRRPTYLLAHHTVDASANDPAAVLAALLPHAARMGMAPNREPKCRVR